MSKPVIVVAEDDDAIRRLLVIELEHRGYEVVPCVDGQDALETITARMPDAVIMDVMMPLMDGNAVLKALRENPVTQNMVVMMVTARSDSDAIHSSFEHGADDYITKPFHADEIDRALRKLLSDGA